LIILAQAFYLSLEIEISIVETFRVLPSSDLTTSEPMLTGPILYPSVSILFTIIWATSTALVMLFPLAFMITIGSFANCTRVAVTYVIKGFFPMKTSLLALRSVFALPADISETMTMLKYNVC
jgi:hypothetical protein